MMDFGISFDKIVGKTTQVLNEKKKQEKSILDKLALNVKNNWTSSRDAAKRRKQLLEEERERERARKAAEEAKRKAAYDHHSKHQ